MTYINNRSATPQGLTATGGVSAMPPEDTLAELMKVDAMKMRKFEASQSVPAQSKHTVPLSPSQQKILIALVDGPKTVKQLTEATGSHTISNLIHMMRCRGLSITFDRTTKTYRLVAK